MARGRPKQSTDVTSDNLSGPDGGAPKAPDTAVRYWLNEISAARKREKDWRKEGQRILDIYTGKKKGNNQTAVPFNILYSNTETLLPALYSSIPRPVVQRRFKDEDVTAKSAALAGTRVLEFMRDTNVEGYETFDDGMRAATLDALLPGRGVTCVKYDAEIGEYGADAETADAAEGDEPVAGPEIAAENAAVGEPTPYKASELVCLDARAWNQVSFGYAKKWSKVPWVAYEEHIDKEEAVRLFGAEVAAKMKFTEGEEEDASDDEGRKQSDDDRNKGERKTACVYQIWDKDGGKKIRWIAAQYGDGFLKVEDDPLELTGFFNCPKPIMFLEKSNDLMPTALYVLYENQANELNEITRRINRVVKAIKAKAIYDAALGMDMDNIVNADDNMFVPSESTSVLSAEKGLQNAIWFWPVEKLIIVLQQLYVARDHAKQVIYEITGIADIMRGASNASETLGAQEIKQQWGTLRLKRLQKEVQRYARDLLRMMLEVAATKFSVETWAQMTGLPFTTEEQRAQAMAITQAAQASGQQPDPQAMAALQAPQWTQVLQLLRNDTQRAYRVDIESNSTLEPEATEDQKNIAEVMNALAQYLNGIGPLVEKGIMPWEAAQGMMLAIVRRFRFGPEIEDYVKAMKPPAPKDDGEAKAKQAEYAAKQQEQQFDFQMKQAEAAQREKESAMKLQQDQQRAQLEAQKMAQEAEYMREEHAIKMAELKGKAAYAELMGAIKMREAEARANAPKKEVASAPA